MPVAITVLYPTEADATFDLDYYLKTHMPLVQDLFGPHGMKGWRVQKLLGTASGEPSPYSIQCVLEFGSKEQFEAALKATGEPIMADVKNFSNKSPLFLVGDVVGTNL